MVQLQRATGFRLVIPVHDWYWFVTEEEGAQPQAAQAGPDFMRGLLPAGVFNKAHQRVFHAYLETGFALPADARALFAAAEAVGVWCSAVRESCSPRPRRWECVVVQFESPVRRGRGGAVPLPLRQHPLTTPPPPARQVLCPSAFVFDIVLQVHALHTPPSHTNDIVLLAAPVAPAGRTTVLL